MLNTVTTVLILGLTLWTIRAQELECATRDIERELQGYVQLESWQTLFQRHLKFFVNVNGEILSEKKRLKFNTIIHNAIFGCDHNRDDEVDDCPNIYRGSIKSCKHGHNVRAAMFRAARCAFVESSVKHLVLSDALVDTCPTNKWDKLSFYVDRPIREFGETVVNVLATLAHGETGGLGELMALNLYLNNRHGTVLMHKLPVEPIASPVDFQVARERMRTVHRALLDGLSAFWGTWCSDRDVVAQYRHKYRDANRYVVVLNEMDRNARDADDLVRGLNVSDNAVDLDLDPRRVALADYVDGLVASRSMPDQLLADVRLRQFEATYQYDPRGLRDYHAHVFRSIYACFYWTAVTQLRLGARIIDRMTESGTVTDNRMGFIVNLVKFVRPLSVFNANRSQFPVAVSRAASGHLVDLLAYTLRLYRTLKRGGAAAVRLIPASAAAARDFADLLCADMRETLRLDTDDGPADYFRDYDYDTAVKLFETNYQAFARLVSTASDYESDRENLTKLKRFMFFSDETAEFERS